MTTHSADYGFHALRAAPHLPRPLVSTATPAPTSQAAPIDWLERLAIWAERQPMHHRMGSYTQPR
jgi:hypothetical protein